MAVNVQPHPHLHFMGFPSQDWSTSPSLQPMHQVVANPLSVSDTGVDTNTDTPLPSSIGLSLSVHVENQKREVDRYIALQNQRLRLVLEEQRKQQRLNLLRKYESRGLSVLKEKNEELVEATRKKVELEECVRRVEMENEAWQKVAEENEMVVMSLNKKLEQMKEKVASAEDAESCCCESSSEDISKKMVCKACNAQRSCVLFLPCKHLCSCKCCEALLDYCPVCKSVKKACIDVFMS